MLVIGEVLTKPRNVVRTASVSVSEVPSPSATVSVIEPVAVPKSATVSQKLPPTAYTGSPVKLMTMGTPELAVDMLPPPENRLPSVEIS